MIDPMTFDYDCTGDACQGDVILFTEGVFGGSVRKPRYLGDRRIVATIHKDSYGADRQQHTFTLIVRASDGIDAIAAGSVIRRKGRNVYRHGTRRKAWTDEAERASILDEKHARGDVARAARDTRRVECWA